MGALEEAVDLLGKFTKNAASEKTRMSAGDQQVTVGVVQALALIAIAVELRSLSEAVTDRSN